jgi:hypothetical protein
VRSCTEYLEDFGMLVRSGICFANSYIFNSRAFHAIYWLSTLVFGFKTNLLVDLGDLQNEKETLSLFLHQKLKVNVTSNLNKLVVDSDALSPEELERIVNKFVYHQNLNSTHWVSLDGRVVKINKVNKSSKKPEKRNRNPTPPTFAHGF